MRHFLCIVVAASCQLAASAQRPPDVPTPDSNHVETHAGLQGTWSHGRGSLFEIGYGRASYGQRTTHGFFQAIALSLEATHLDRWVFGPKLSIWQSGGSPPGALALSVSYLSDWQGERGSLRLQPEVGVGLGIKGWMLGYGYGWILLGSQQPEVSGHQVVLRLFWGLARR